MMDENKSVLLDTSFFIAFLNEKSNLHENAKGYYRCFIERKIDMFISSIAIAEYCVHGKIEELPLRTLKVIPFNINHTERAGEFANSSFNGKKSGTIEGIQRVIIPNDTKLFAQADSEQKIGYYLTSDTKSNKIYSHIKENNSPKFEFMDLNKPYNDFFGILDLL